MIWKIAKRGLGGLVLGIIGTCILIWEPFYFYSSWAFILLLFLFFVKRKLLNAGVYWTIVVAAIAITRESIAPLILLPVPVICFVLSALLARCRQRHEFKEKAAHL